MEQELRRVIKSTREFISKYEESNRISIYDQRLNITEWRNSGEYVSYLRLNLLSRALLMRTHTDHNTILTLPEIEGVQSMVEFSCDMNEGMELELVKEITFSKVKLDDDLNVILKNRGTVNE